MNTTTSLWCSFVLLNVLFLYTFLCRLLFLSFLLSFFFSLFLCMFPCAKKTQDFRILFSSSSQDAKNLFGIRYANFPLQAVRQQILQLLTPVTMNHTIVFLASLADVWYQRRRREGSGSKATRGVPVASEEQIIVVDIVYAIKVERASAFAWCPYNLYWSLIPRSIWIYLKTVPFASKAHQTFSVHTIVFALHTKTLPRPGAGNTDVALITVVTSAFSERFVFANTKNTEPAFSTLKSVFEKMRFQCSKILL